MSNRHVQELQNLWNGILEDATHAFPTLRDEFERDLARLVRLVAHRGIRVFLEDLPAIGKHFDRCLSCGQYKLSGLPLTKRYSNTVVIPKFLRGLYLLVFHESGRLKEDCDVEALFFVRQLTLAFKKGKLRCSAKKDSCEVVEFFAVDSSLPTPEGYWEAQDFTPPRPEAESPLRGRTAGGEVRTSQQAFARREGCSEALTDVRFNKRVLGDSHLQAKPCKDLAGRRLIYEGFAKSALYISRARSCASGDIRQKQLSVLLTRLDFVSGLVTATLGSYNPSAWRFRHGKGAVSEYVGPANKYYWNNWSEALESGYPIADCGFYSYSSWVRRIQFDSCPGSQELGSRLLCVPKTFSKPRLIAAEPSANMWCQQNLWHYFSTRSRSTWINRFVRFNDQSLNQELCTRGSLTGALATIDLSAASDRVTCHAVGQMFRGNPALLNCLKASRTQFVTQKITTLVPSVIRLNKFSTMGSACTFPVESLLFLSIALATVLTQRGLRPTKRNVESLFGEVAVYGDDVVIPVDSRGLFVDALEVLHFKVNGPKSYWNGSFRESCGVDAFRGVNVTPAYWRSFNDGKPESLASTVGARNNFYKKFLLSAADRLASTIPSQIVKVHVRSGVFGLKSFIGPDYKELYARYNTLLQRPEVLILDLVDRSKRLPIEDDSALFQYFTENPDPFSKWSSGIPQRPVTKLRPRWVALTDLGAPCPVDS